MNIEPTMYRGYRYPPANISHAVWLYHRFCLSFRDVEDVLAERGIIVSYETIREWFRKFGPSYRLKSYSAARRTTLASVVHVTERYANNRVEVSHEPTPQREYKMRRFKSPGQAQRFRSVHAVVGNARS